MSVTSTSPGCTQPGTLDEAPIHYRWAAAGDINAFFGLMLDNVVNLAVLAGILVGAFGFPAPLVYTRMFPGTALGVLFGDVVYTIISVFPYTVPQRQNGKISCFKAVALYTCTPSNLL